HRVAHGAGDIDAARLRHRLQPRGHIDAIAVDVVTHADDVADVDADSEHDPLHRRHRLVALGHAALHFDRTAHGIDRACELDQQAVARRLDDAARVAGDGGVYQFPAAPIQRTKRPDLTGPHRVAVPNTTRAH